MARRASQPRSEPDAPPRLSRRSWGRVLVNTVKEAPRDNLQIWAGALTYYGVLSLFPGILMVTAVVELLDARLIGQVLSSVLPLFPAAVREILSKAFTDVQQNPRKAGVAAVLALAVGLWSTSGYVNAFMKASNAIYEVPEGRPLWKRLPIRLAVTLATGALLILSIFVVVLSGRLAQALGGAMGMSGGAQAAWRIVKWPALLVLVGLMLDILYWAAPNARQGGFRWVTPGGFVAVVLWVIASAGFAVYAANFSRYTAVFGALGAVVVFLIWLWLSNLAILFGAEFDAALERERAIAAGHPADREPYFQLRDDRKIREARDARDDDEARDDRGFPRSGSG
jgi:membrane protein